MITGPRYKIARRLGPSIFEKTQSQKFALRNQKKDFAPKGRAKSDFGMQLIEKQKARFTYGIGERQFKNYVKNAGSQKATNINEALVQSLEKRLDNVVYRLGFAKTRQASRQMVNHGHIDVNGKRHSIPSFQVKIGDVITIRESSKAKPIFKDLNEKLKEARVPSWLALDVIKKEAKVQGAPKINPAEFSFDISAIFQYYSR
ncbi:MAG: 30S ribosomal protein S4 [Candidatus Paceibacterota bacterium]|jgi:small subunit ribosomal protein S4